MQTQTMNKDKITDVLIDLCQLDIDAVGAYDIALKHMDDADIFKHITAFKNDHVNHINKLSGLIKKYNEEPPANTPDLKGYLISGITTLKSVTGLKGALKAMESNEETTNKKYKEALTIATQNSFPEDVVEILRANLNDEKIHLSYIQKALEQID